MYRQYRQYKILEPIEHIPVTSMCLCDDCYITALLIFDRTGGNVLRVMWGWDLKSGKEVW